MAKTKIYLLTRRQTRVVRGGVQYNQYVYIMFYANESLVPAENKARGWGRDKKGKRQINNQIL